ncbi:BnaA06g01620D [Brassica napus]|uniref:(rape) hypothetical protein n=1 Tax=Brassica napus TaxID=3708 RepID=A0A078ISM3_BRANA|nr:unnamed protein product [Brassica napus]CDY52977.1 BnaA06g01620D [Brassica napus]
MKLWTSFNILDLVCAMMLTMMSRVVQPLHVGLFRKKLFGSFLCFIAFVIF